MRRPARRALVAAALAGMACTAAADDAIELDGEWLTDDDERVRVTRSGSDVVVTLIGGGACPNGGAREFLIKARLQGDALRGEMQRCTRDPHLVTDCGLSSVYSVPMEATVAPDLVTGTWRSEYYAAGGSGECDFSRDPSGDADVPFALFRVQPDEEERIAAVPVPEPPPPKSDKTGGGGQTGREVPGEGETGDTVEAPDAPAAPGPEGPGDMPFPGGADLGCWTGELTGTETEHGAGDSVREHRFSVQYRLQEQVITEGAGIRFLQLVHAGSRMRNEAVGRYYDNVCHMSGEVALTADDPGGAIFLNDGEMELEQFGCRLPPGAAVYTLDFGSYTGSLVQHCSDPGLTPADIPYPLLGIVNDQLARDECQAVSFQGDRDTMSGRNSYRTAGSEVSVQWHLNRTEGSCALPDESTDTVQLGDVFEANKAEIRPEAGALLSGLASRLAADADLRAVVTVVVPDTGDPLWDEALGRARGTQLKRWLADHGADPGQVSLDPPQAGGAGNVQVRFEH